MFQKLNHIHEKRFVILLLFFFIESLGVNQTAAQVAEPLPKVHNSYADQQQEKQRQIKEREDILKLKDTQPEKFVHEYEKYLIDLEAKNPNLPGDLEGYIGLGHFSRFMVHQPEKAIAFYQKAEGLSQKSRFTGISIPGFEGFKIADVYQYDLHDKNHAIKYYREISDKNMALMKQYSPEYVDTGGGWLNEAMKNEIGYLETGKPFSGSISKHLLPEFMMIMVMTQADLAGRNFSPLDIGLQFDRVNRIYQENQNVDSKIILQKLNALPRSHMVLASTIQAISYLPTPESVLEYLESQDPGRYWSASILFMARLDEMRQTKGPSLFPGLSRVKPGTSSPLRLAGDQFQKKTGITFDMENYPRFSKPQELWHAFSSALTEGDIEAALQYITFSERGKYRNIFKKLPPEAIKGTAQATAYCEKNSFEDGKPDFGLPTYGMTCELIRIEAGKTFSYPLYLVEDQFGDWRIQSF